MKHYIMAKFKGEVANKAALMPRIREIFSVADQIEGIHGATVLENCTPRDNRYDVMIVIDMDASALTTYDDCAMHHCWKDEFGPLLEKKAIFDHE